MADTIPNKNLLAAVSRWETARAMNKRAIESYAASHYDRRQRPEVMVKAAAFKQAEDELQATYENMFMFTVLPISQP